MFSKKEACALLGISPRTLERRVAKGIYSCTRTGEGQYAALSFTYADLALPEPVLESAVEPAKEPTAVQVVEAPPVPRPALRDLSADEQFAADYKAGIVPDSFGNFIGNADPKRSLIGTIDREKLGKPKDFNAGYRIGGPDLTEHAGSDNNPLIAQRIARGEFAPTKAPNPDPNKAFAETVNAIMRDIKRGISR